MPAESTSARKTLTDLLFEKAGVGLCLVAPDGTVVRANAEWLRSTGFTEERVVGENIVDLFPDTRDMALALHARARAGHRVEVPRHAQVVNDRDIWWDGSIEPVAMDGGPGLLITAREVGAALRETEDRQRRILEHVSDGIFLADASGRYTDVNPAGCAMLGMTRDEVLSSTFVDVLAPGEIDRLPTAIASLGDGNVHRSEWRYRRKDGSVFVGELDGRRLPDGTFQGILRDVTERSRAEEMLRARDAEFAALIAEVHSGVALIDAGGRFTLYNHRFLEMFGLSCDADIKNVNSLDWSAWQVFDQHGRLLDVDEHPVRKATLTREPVRDQLVAVRLPSGGPRQWMLVSAEPILSREGKLVQVICTYHDVTEQKGSEEALRSANARLKATIDSITDGVLVLDRAWRYTYVSERAGEIVGVRPESLVGGCVWDLFPHARGTKFYDEYHRAVDTGQPVHFEEYYPEPLNQWLECHCYPMADGLTVYFHDVTERRIAEEALRESERRLRRYAELVEHAPVLVRNIDGEIIVWNRGMEALYGWSRDEVLGKRSHEVLATRFPQPVSEITATVLRDGLWEGELVHRRRNGSDIVVASAWLLHEDEGGGPGAIIEVNNNITELKRAEEALREADRRKDEFLGMLSHELRNPLAPIRNSTYILQHAAPGSDQAQRAQAVIQRQTEHLTRLVDDLLDVTRIARGKIELRRSRVDLRDVVWRAADDFRLVMHDRGIRYDVEIPDDKLWTVADATRVTQMIGNLLHNAAKFTRKGDAVTLSLLVDASTATIRVQDTGAGIDAELLPRVFEAFVQGERTLARTEGGLGLGLALVKGIAELHGGSAQASSAGKGRGSEFTVRLPLLATLAPEPHTAARTDQRNRGRRVLIVDDNADAAESLADIVRMLGHSVEVAYDGPSALERAHAGAPEVVLCDLGLPGMSGYDVAQALRATRMEDLQLIAVSGYAQVEDVKRAIEAGFDGHVAKPCDPEKIERLLG